jgi:hypothetical protein
MGLGVLTIVLAALGLNTLGVTAILALPLGLAVWRVASSDLKEMEAGTRDPAGRSGTRDGRNCARIGVALSAVGGLIALGAGFFFLCEALGD